LAPPTSPAHRYDQQRPMLFPRQGLRLASPPVSVLRPASIVPTEVGKAIRKAIPVQSLDDRKSNSNA
jgi:hypothetical protein